MGTHQQSRWFNRHCYSGRFAKENQRKPVDHGLVLYIAMEIALGFFEKEAVILI
jgi:hypothetical protein